MTDDRSNAISDRVLALAGLAQALAQVRRIADTGQAHDAILATSLDSVFRIDAATPADVYGGIASLRPGLTLLRDRFEGRASDDQMPRLALSVLQLERRFVREAEMGQRVRDRITEIRAMAERQGSSSHPEVLSALGNLYSETLSHLRPRVLVQGNPHYLGQASVVAEVRAVLLAAVRSAVLWRQLGGSYWDFAFSKGAMRQAAEQALR